MKMMAASQHFSAIQTTDGAIAFDQMVPVLARKCSNKTEYPQISVPKVRLYTVATLNIDTSSQ